MARKSTFYCPHCGSKLINRTSKLENPLLRVSYYTCENVQCGFSCRAESEIVAEISPSAVSNPQIKLKKYKVV